MTFQSIRFLIFFPLTVLIYYLLHEKYRSCWVLICSLFFYACFDVRFLSSLAVCIAVCWLSGILMEKTQSKMRRAVEITALVILFLQLAYCKYTGFLISILNDLGIMISLSNTPLLPVGISFFTFEAAGYVIDVYHSKYSAEHSLFSIALFLSFFPQILSGPIARADRFLPQIKESHAFDYKKVRNGLLMMLWGFFLKMVIADRCGLYVDEVFDHYDHYSGITVVLAFILYGIEIYADFAGYSKTAQGAAACLGYELADNFHQPYLAVSVKDFWRRWHISLSLWLRDYIYIPLGGSRCSKIKKYRNIMITFLISGLWHGADWTFVFWGFLHGLFQIIEDLIPKKKKGTGNIILTFILVDFAWIFFRAPTMQDAWWLIQSAVRFGNIGQLLSGEVWQITPGPFGFVMLAIGMIIMLAVDRKEESGVHFTDWILSRGRMKGYLYCWGLVLMIVFSMGLSTGEFIYFQF